MEQLRKPSTNKPNTLDSRQRREYQLLASQIKGVHLIDYEDCVVVARTILDAAQDEGVGDVSARPHILLAFSRHGSVNITRQGSQTICSVSMRKAKRGERGKYSLDKGFCEIHDPSGAVFQAASSSLDYVKKLFMEYGR